MGTVLVLFVLIVANPAFNSPVAIFICGLTTRMSIHPWSGRAVVTAPANIVVQRIVNGRSCNKTVHRNKIGFSEGRHVMAGETA